MADKDKKLVKITGNVDIDLYDRVISDLHEADKKTGPVIIYLNSDGGSVTQAFAIYDSIKLMKNHVTIYVFGEASSSGAIILQAADERVMTPNSICLVHEGSESLGDDDHPRNVKRWKDHYERVQERVNKIFLEKIREVKKRFSREKLQDLLEFDTILDAKETVEYGLADRIEDKEI